MFDPHSGAPLTAQAWTIRNPDASPGQNPFLQISTEAIKLETSDVAKYEVGMHGSWREGTVVGMVISTSSRDGSGKGPGSIEVRRNDNKQTSLSDVVSKNSLIHTMSTSMQDVVCNIGDTVVNNAESVPAPAENTRQQDSLSILSMGLKARQGAGPPQTNVLAVRCLVCIAVALLFLGIVRHRLSYSGFGFYPNSFDTTLKNPHLPGDRWLDINLCPVGDQQFTVKLREAVSDSTEESWSSRLSTDTDGGKVQMLLFIPLEKQEKTGTADYTAFVSAPFYLWFPHRLFRAFTFNIIKPRRAKVYTNITASGCNDPHTIEQAVQKMIEKSLPCSGISYSVLQGVNAGINVWDPTSNRLIFVQQWSEYHFPDVHKYIALCGLNFVLVFIATSYGVYGSFKLVIRDSFLKAVEDWDDYMPRTREGGVFGLPPMKKGDWIWLDADPDKSGTVMKTSHACCGAKEDSLQIDWHDDLESTSWISRNRLFEVLSEGDRVQIPVSGQTGMSGLYEEGSINGSGMGGGGSGDPLAGSTNVTQKGVCCGRCKTGGVSRAFLEGVVDTVTDDNKRCGTVNVKLTSMAAPHAGAPTIIRTYRRADLIKAPKLPIEAFSPFFVADQIVGDPITNQDGMKKALKASAIQALLFVIPSIIVPLFAIWVDIKWTKKPALLFTSMYLALSTIGSCCYYSKRIPWRRFRYLVGLFDFVMSIQIAVSVFFVVNLVFWMLAMITVEPGVAVAYLAYFGTLYSYVTTTYRKLMDLHRKVVTECRRFRDEIKGDVLKFEQLQHEILEKFGLRYMDIIALVVGGILLLSLVFSWVMVAQILLGGATGNETMSSLLTGAITPIVGIIKSSGDKQEGTHSKFQDEMDKLGVVGKLQTIAKVGDVVVDAQAVVVPKHNPLVDSGKVHVL